LTKEHIENTMDVQAMLDPNPDAPRRLMLAKSGVVSNEVFSARADGSKRWTCRDDGRQCESG
jgi:hypothetical protein